MDQLREFKNCYENVRFHYILAYIFIPYVGWILLWLLDVAQECVSVSRPTVPLYRLYTVAIFFYVHNTIIMPFTDYHTIFTEVVQKQPLGLSFCFGCKRADFRYLGLYNLLAMCLIHFYQISCKHLIRQVCKQIVKVAAFWRVLLTSRFIFW